MTRCAAALIAALALIAPAAQAVSATAPVGQFVELQPVGLPIVVRGQLVNYIFVYIRLNLSAEADTPTLRAKEPVFRDALVRLAHRTPFTLAKDYNKIDEKRLAASFLNEANAIGGPGTVTSVVITQSFPRYHIPVPKG